MQKYNTCHQVLLIFNKT